MKTELTLAAGIPFGKIPLPAKEVGIFDLEREGPGLPAVFLVRRLFGGLAGDEFVPWKNIFQQPANRSIRICVRADS